MLRFKKTITAIALGMLISVGPAMASDQPGKGVTVNPARATWNTGFFQEALVRRALETLGYNVKNQKISQILFFTSLWHWEMWITGVMAGFRIMTVSSRKTSQKRQRSMAMS